MYLNDFDLRQLAARSLEALSVAEKDQLLGKLLSDLIEARERLQAHSKNSSRPPSSDPPWSGPGRRAGRDEDEAESQFGSKSIGGCPKGNRRVESCGGAQKAGTSFLRLGLTSPAERRVGLRHPLPTGLTMVSD